MGFGAAPVEGRVSDCEGRRTPISQVRASVLPVHQRFHGDVQSGSLIHPVAALHVLFRCLPGSRILREQ